MSDKSFSFLITENAKTFQQEQEKANNIFEKINFKNSDASEKLNKILITFEKHSNIHENLNIKFKDILKIYENVDINDKYKDIIHNFFSKEINNLSKLEEVRIEYLGKKGVLTEQLKGLGAASPEERKTLGQALNVAKDAISATIDAQHQALNLASINARLESERVDVTLAPRHETIGRIHPVTQVIEEITAIFAAQGFSVKQGPEIEDDFHNFSALNIPPEHPARQMHDTFYLVGEEGQPKPVLRTHTSPVQIRTMVSQKPPLRIIAPGSTFRCDSDLTHTPMFHQIEGLVIDKAMHMGHLKGCIIDFIKAFFGIEDVPVRFRASFFPFTEPSAEVDIGCSREKGELKIGAGKDWLEVMGCGMVHPSVLMNCGIDPNEYQGFAFGLGVERMAMLKYGIPDLRTFFDADIRWLQHYGFAPLDIPALVSAYAK